MAKSKHASPAKRKKAHQPKGYDKNAMFHTIRNNWRASAVASNDGKNDAALRARFSQQVGGQQQEELSAEYRTALVAMRMGNGDLDDFSMLTSALNTGLVMAERGFGEEYVPTFMKALDAIAQAYATYKATGKWEWDDEANEAMNDGIDIHAAQLEHALQADVLSAMAEVAKRIDASQVIIKEAA
jgi:hypothetical protein